MSYGSIILVVALTFALCFLLDKGFHKLLRSKPQHHSGLSVHLNKMYGIGGIVLAFLGVCAIITGLTDAKLLLIGGIFILIFGLGLCVYYLSFGIFYDDNSFVCTTFGKKERVVLFSEIRAQQLYVVTGGSLLVELHLTDGTAVTVQTTMDGAYPFLDAAFAGWCRQKSVDPQSCAFHDPSNHLWFPTEEV